MEKKTLKITTAETNPANYGWTGTKYEFTKMLSDHFGDSFTNTSVDDFNCFDVEATEFCESFKALHPYPIPNHALRKLLFHHRKTYGMKTTGIPTEKNGESLV